MKEFSATTTKKWSAGDFKEWSNATNFLKSLRNHIAHEGPLTLYETTTIGFPKGFVESPIGMVSLGKKYDFVCVTSFMSQQIGKVKTTVGAKIINFHDHLEHISLRPPVPTSTIQPSVLFVRKNRAKDAPAQYIDKDLFLPRRIFMDYKIPFALQNQKENISAIKLIKDAHQIYSNYYLFYKNELKNTNLGNH